MTGDDSAVPQNLLSTQCFMNVFLTYFIIYILGGGRGCVKLSTWTLFMMYFVALLGALSWSSINVILLQDFCYV